MSDIKLEQAAVSDALLKAREYESSLEAGVKPEERPLYHFSPRTGWLNDPNGFSFYNGKYHLFYQYHPYDSLWGPMHWGHAASDDMVRWEYLPCALAPDEGYDADGCFSGTAVTMDDGSHLMMYTSVVKDGLDPEELGRFRQTQSIAVRQGTPAGTDIGDTREASAPGCSGNIREASETDGAGYSREGLCPDEYIKYKGNPVIAEEDLPEDGDIYEFRDPYLYRGEDGSYRAVVSCARKSAVPSEVKSKGKPRGGTRILDYRSDDGYNWTYSGTLFEDDSRIGIMWECPSYFALDGRQILMASPMDMEAEEADGTIRFPKGNNVCYMVGDKAAGGRRFEPERDGEGRIIYSPVDSGLDFYASQVMTAPDGRAVMIAWMQNPETSNRHDKSVRIYGQMTLPRELRLSGGRLVQKPVREIEAYRRDKVEYMSVKLGGGSVMSGDVRACGDGWMSLDGVSGRTADLEITVRPECEPASFAVRFSSDGEHYTELSYNGVRSEMTLDRSHARLLFDLDEEEAGRSLEAADDILDRGALLRRTIKVRDRDGVIELRILLDRYSAEVFVNGGEQVMTVTYEAGPGADGISFRAYGPVLMDVVRYSLG